MEKLCWFCKHFSYSQADRGYSEYTPGSDFGMSCYKNKWSFHPFDDSQAAFAAKLSYAKECPDFEVNEYVAVEMAKVKLPEKP